MYSAQLQALVSSTWFELITPPIFGKVHHSPWPDHFPEPRSFLKPALIAHKRGCYPILISAWRLWTEPDIQSDSCKRPIVGR